MFSIFTPVKSSLGQTRKTEDYEELTRKLNDATKQLRDPLLTEEDRERLYDTIDYCVSRISTFAIRPTPSQQPATAPEPDNAAEGQNDPLATTEVHQNPNTLPDPPNPATNPAYHPPSPPRGLQAPFQSPAPYQMAQNTISTPRGTVHVETILDENKEHPGAVEERIARTVITSRQSRATFDDKKKRQFYESFVTGLPKGKGYKNVHLEDLMVVKDNDHAILAAVDILRINEHLARKFHQTQSHDIFNMLIGW